MSNLQLCFDLLNSWNKDGGGEGDMQSSWVHWSTIPLTEQQAAQAPGGTISLGCQFENPSFVSANCSVWANVLVKSMGPRWEIIAYLVLLHVVHSFVCGWFFNLYGLEEWASDIEKDCYLMGIWGPAGLYGSFQREFCGTQVCTSAHSTFFLPGGIS